MTTLLWIDVLDAAARACAVHDRPDLVGTLRARRARLLDPKLWAVVVGGPGQGKSQLINALINAPVCPVGDGATTALPTVVRHAEQSGAMLVRRPVAAAGAAAARTTAAVQLETTPMAVAEIATWISGGAGRGIVPRRARGTVHAEIGVKRALLASGLVLIDTPAINTSAVETPAADTSAVGTRAIAGQSAIAGRSDTAGRSGAAGRSDTAGRGGAAGRGAGAMIAGPGTGAAGTGWGDDSRAMLSRADTVILASDATKEISEAELDTLREAARVTPSIVVALTKIDMVPEWRAVAERTRRRLAGAGIAASVIPVSSVLRLRAAQGGDKALNAESGFPELIARLSRDIAGKTNVLARDAAAQTARDVAEQLAAPLRAELAAEGKGGPPRSLAVLTEAQRGFDELRRRSVRWQNTLGDEMAGLVSNVDYDLRDRTRLILRQVDEAFDDADPLRSWEEFQEWLDRSLLEAARANFAWLIAHCDWVTYRVAEYFAPYGQDAVPPWRMHVPDDLGDLIPRIAQPRIESFTVSQKAMTGLRGSYGGILMFGLATSLAGMPLINPISIGAGALFGGKSVLDEGKSLLKRRQATAKMACQRHVDDFFLRLSKESKDTARQAQQMLRDHFTTVTDQLQDAIVRSLHAAKKAADADVAERSQRQREVELKLQDLVALHRQAQKLTVGRDLVGWSLPQRAT